MRFFVTASYADHSLWSNTVTVFQNRNETRKCRTAVVPPKSRKHIVRVGKEDETRSQ